MDLTINLGHLYFFFSMVLRHLLQKGGEREKSREVEDSHGHVERGKEGKRQE